MQTNPSSTQFCSQCGAALQTNTRFCPSCGQPIASLAVGASANPAATPMTPPAQPPKQKGSWVYGLIAAVIVGGAGYAAYNSFNETQTINMQTANSVQDGLSKQIQMGHESIEEQFDEMEAAAGSNDELRDRIREIRDEYEAGKNDPEKLNQVMQKFERLMQDIKSS